MWKIKTLSLKRVGSKVLYALTAFAKEAEAKVQLKGYLIANSKWCIIIIKLCTNQEMVSKLEIKYAEEMQHLFSI